MHRSQSVSSDDEIANEVLDVFLKAFANRVLELAYSPGGAGLASLGLHTAGGQLTEPSLGTVIASKPKRIYGRYRTRPGTGA